MVFIGWIWLTVLGFKQSVLWGILVLIFSPVAAVFFSIKYKAWVPFAIYMIGLIMALTGMRMVVTS